MFQNILREIFIPIVFGLALVQLAVICFSIIHFLSEIEKNSVAFTFLLFILVYINQFAFSTFCLNAVEHTELSREWRDSKRRNNITLNAYNSRFIRSLQLLKMKVGNLGDVKRSTLLLLVYHVMEKTITLLIVTK